MDIVGSCMGSCTHVWNYEQTTPFLFGELAKLQRTVEFGHATNEMGLMSFRVNLPIENAQKMNRAAADGQMGTIMKMYRDWQLSGDDDLLKTLWPKVKKAIEFCWIEGGWDLAQSIEFCKALKATGCDMVDVSSGGIDQSPKITTGPGYQVHFAEAIRREAGVPTLAVGQITEAIQAETILATGQADMVALARGMLWDPRWTWRAAVALGEEIAMPAPYARANPALRGKPFITRT